MLHVLLAVALGLTLGNPASLPWVTPLWEEAVPTGGTSTPTGEGGIDQVGWPTGDGSGLWDPNG